LKRFLKIGLAIFVSFGLVAAVGSFAYWQYLKTTPQYSLAVLVDAARRDDKARVTELVDSDAVVEEMLPQVVDKAIEMYARGLPVAVIAKATIAASPLMPAVKERARAELPNLIRGEAERFRNAPLPLMVLGARRYLDIRIDGDTAFVKGKDPEDTTEVILKRAGDRWKVVGVHDEKLAGRIARAIGQEIMGALMNGGESPNGRTSLDSLIQQVQPMSR